MGFATIAAVVAYYPVALVIPNYSPAAARHLRACR
jgi:hypothetical protein